MYFKTQIVKLGYILIFKTYIHQIQIKINSIDFIE